MEISLFLDEKAPRNHGVQMFLDSFNEYDDNQMMHEDEVQSQQRDDETIHLGQDLTDLNLHDLDEDSQILPSPLDENILWESDLMERDTALKEREREQAEYERRTNLAGLRKVIDEESVRLAKMEQEQEKARAIGEEEDKEQEERTRNWGRELEQRRKKIMARKEELARARAQFGNLTKATEELREMTDKVDTFKTKLKTKIQMTCQKERDGRSNDLVKDMEAALETFNEFIEKRKNLSFYDSVDRNETTETAVTDSVRGSSGDGPGRRGNGPRHGKGTGKCHIPLNTPDNLTNVCIQLNEDRYDHKVPLPEVVRKSFAVSRLNTMMNMDTLSTTYENAYVVSLGASTGGSGMDSGDRQKDDMFVIGSGVGQTANDAFKSALNIAHQHLERVSRSRANSTSGSMRSSQR